MPQSRLRVAIVGCGAIAELGHLPAARQVDEVALVGVVDSDRARAEALAARFRVPRAAASLAEVADATDAVILATPPHVRPALAAEAFAAGLHVLCEKPLANSSAECQEILRAAAGARRVLAVAHTYRFFPNRQRVQALLRQGALGRVRQVEVEEGTPTEWPTRTGYTFRRELVSGGVLLNLGIHSLDALFWWFGHPVEALYQDDAVGGLESNARIRLRFAEDVVATVRLSRTCRLANRIRVEGEAGALTLPVYDQLQLTEEWGSKAVTRKVAAGKSGVVRVVAAQLRDFAESIAARRPPAATGADGLRVVQFIEQCYAAKRARPLPARAPIPGVTW